MLKEADRNANLKLVVLYPHKCIRSYRCENVNYSRAVRNIRVYKDTSFRYEGCFLGIIKIQNLSCITSNNLSEIPYCVKQILYVYVWNTEY